MRLLRALLNLILAVITLGVICVMLVVGWGLIATQSRENMGLDFVSGNAAEPDEVDLGDWLWLDGEPIHYQTWGAGEDDPYSGGWVVLVHGAQVEGGQTWHQVAPLIARGGKRVIAVDLPGMGRSTRNVDPSDTTVRAQAESLAMVLNELHIQEASFIAHGWGSAVALQLAYEQPQFVSRLVLVSPELDSPWPERVRRHASIPYAGRSVAWMVAGGGPYHRWLQEQAMVAPDALPPNYWASVRQYLLMENTASALTNAMAAEEDDDLPEVLSRIQQPAEIVVGELVSEEQLTCAKTLQGGLPSATSTTMPDAGTQLHIERAPLLAQRLLDLLR